ncbi:MAG: hypothetical protein OEW39_02395 [Deltaproteobacteria bacterium]|nr:hypothetical protein [Deltaproteobacteria bacterium]
MRRFSLPWLILLLVLAGPDDSQAQTRGLGAYFTLVNSYIYTTGPLEGPRLVARARRAFPVTQFMLDSKDRLWFRILFTDYNRKVRGEGWTTKLPHELLPTEREPVLVFAAPLGKDDSNMSTLRLPVNSMTLLNETTPSDTFTRVVWQKIKYEVDQPIEAWIRDTGGVFRAGKSPDFMVRSYGEMVTRDVDRDKLTRLLSGVVHLGDSPTDVEWALGTPLRKQEETVPDAVRSTWEYPEIVVRFENAIVKQLN